MPGHDAYDAIDRGYRGDGLAEDGRSLRSVSRRADSLSMATGRRRADSSDVKDLRRGMLFGASISKI